MEAIPGDVCGEMGSSVDGREHLGRKGSVLFMF